LRVRMRAKGRTHPSIYIQTMGWVRIELKSSIVK